MALMASLPTEMGETLMSNPLVSPKIIDAARLLNEEFRSATPFRHIVIDNFLRGDVAERMASEFPSAGDPASLLNEFGNPNPKSVISDVKGIGGVFAEVDRYIQTDGFLRLMETITGIPDLRYDPWYYGAGTHENFHGAGLEAHYDFNIHPKTAYHRRINAIIYLNEEWSSDWAGDICFHTDPWDLQNDVKTSIVPEFNRCVIFETTEHSWHSVTPVSLPEAERHRSRKSFTIYLYTETRPAAQTAPEHGTVYVPPPLPSHICEGRTLDAADMAEINTNLYRRHEYLKQMYRREYRFSAIIESLKRQVAEWKSFSRVPICGRGEVKKVIDPLFTDQWMGKRLHFVLRVDRPIERLTFNYWRPDEVRDPTKFNIVINDHEEAFSIEGGGAHSLVISRSCQAEELLDVRLEVDSVWQASENDERLVSFILSSIELE